jgi:hypothetical protein
MKASIKTKLELDLAIEKRGARLYFISSDEGTRSVLIPWKRFIDLYDDAGISDEKLLEDIATLRRVADRLERLFSKDPI